VSNEHFMFAEETTWGTFVPPDTAIPVRTANVTGSMPLMIPDVTGGGRADRQGAVGEIGVGPGDVTTLLYPVDVGMILRSAFGTRAATAAGTGFRNKLLPDDDVAFDTFSLQKRYSPTLAESIRGAKLAGWTIGARTREFATITFSFVGKDSVMTPSGVWSDGTSAPAVVDPPPYTTPFPEAFTFYQGVIRTGGTVALTSGELVVTGGTARNDFDNIEIQANYNVSQDAYGVNLGDRTVQSLDEGKREITVRFEPNWSLQGTAEFYNAWKNGDKAVVELFFQGPIFNASNHYEMKITLPDVVYSNGANPDLNAQYGLKRTTVEGRAFLDSTLLVDIGVVIQTTQDLTA